MGRAKNGNGSEPAGRAIPRLLLVACLFVLVNPAPAQTFDLQLLTYPEAEGQGLFELHPFRNGRALLYGHHFALSDAPGRGGLLLELDARTGTIVQAEKVVNQPAQIRDVIVRADGSTTLLTSYQSRTDFRHRFGLIHRAPDGTQLDSRSWIGSMEAVTELPDGSYFVAGGKQEARGLIAIIGPDGTIRRMQRLLPATNRPAKLVDAHTLPNGDVLTLGFFTSSVGGVAQPELTLTRFTSAGSIIWAKKITPGRFFLANQQSLFLRAPNRLQFDAEGNVYIGTFLGHSTEDWRRHVLKLTPDGELIYSRSFLTPGQSAGQGRMIVLGSGTVVFAFESSLGLEAKKLTLLRVSTDGRPMDATQLSGETFDISGLMAADGHFLVTGTTLDCAGDRRTTYLTSVSTELQFGTGACPSQPVTYTAEDVDLEILPFDFSLEDVPVEPQEAPRLGPATVTPSPAPCHIPDVDTTIFLCSGEAIVYDPEIIAGTQVQWTDNGSNVGQRRLNLPGMYHLSVAGECTDYAHRVTVEAALTPLARRDTLTQCNPGDPVLLAATDLPGTPVRWEDGDTTRVRTVREPGAYPYELRTDCGAVPGRFTVLSAAAGATGNTVESITLCLGDSVRYRFPDGPGLTASWLDGFPPQDRSLTLPGRYRLSQTDGCGEAVTEIRVTGEDCCSLYLPTAFSPNDDGVNDRYFPEFGAAGCAAVEDLRIDVYDRWGGRVHTGKEAWTGADLDTGTYLVVVTYANAGVPARVLAEVVLSR